MRCIRGTQMPRMCPYASLLLRLWVLCFAASAAAFQLPRSRLLRFSSAAEGTQVFQLRCRQALRAANAVPDPLLLTYREAFTPHVSIDKIPRKAPPEDVLYLLGEPRVVKVYATPPIRRGEAQGGKMYLTCADVAAAEKLLNTPPSMLGPSRHERVYIRRESCAFDETRIVHVSGLPVDCTEESVRQLASQFGQVERLILFKLPSRESRTQTSAQRALFRRRITPTQAAAALVVFDKPESAKNMSDFANIPFKRYRLQARLVCNDYQLHSYDIIRTDPQISQFRVSFSGIPTNWAESEIVTCLNKYGIAATDVKLGIKQVLLNGTIVQSGTATAGVGTFSSVMKASFLINNETEGFFASGVPPPDGSIIPYVIRNVPDDKVVSRKDWLEHFAKQDIDTIFRVRAVKNADNTRDLLLDVATLRDAPKFVAINGTEINGFRVELHRRYVVERDRFYSKARESFCKTFHLGAFDFDRFVFLFPGEGTSPQSSPDAAGAGQNREQQNNRQHEQNDDNTSQKED